MSGGVLFYRTVFSMRRIALFIAACNMYPAEMTITTRYFLLHSTSLSVVMAQTSSKPIWNSFPEDVLLEIARYLSNPELSALLVSCRHYHQALNPVLYRVIHIDIPAAAYPPIDTELPSRTPGTFKR
ncbi:hypothetical protein NUW54_g5776 [Trametes sanguinea]|uniref:Uncharacterized protein n=1 Tax=Trametes sanguinea TaxID=158606 RepID=A0ACC1PVS9_9APHY|nr:hypothetical protein NUW54_g5776 [Trametes sanguinea]